MKTDAKKQFRQRPPPRTADPELRALYERIGVQVRRLRDMEGLSQRDACIAVFGQGGETMQGNWSRMERGLNLPNVGTLHQIARYFGVSLAEIGLFEPQDGPSPAEIAAAREHMEKAQALLGG